MSEPDYTKKLIDKLGNLEKKLDTLIKLVAITSSMETMKKEPQKKQIKTLSGLGLSRGLIALLVGTTPLTVSVTLSQMKRGKKQKKVKKDNSGRRVKKAERKN